jgi:hypothetical protein
MTLDWADRIMLALGTIALLTGGLGLLAVALAANGVFGL